MGDKPVEVVGIGDRSEDALALRAAGVPAYGAGWNPQLELEVGWLSVLDESGAILQGTLNREVSDQIFRQNSLRDFCGDQCCVVLQSTAK